MGVAFVTGMQGDDPKYYRVISTPKHFAVHSGPEPTRHTADVDVSKHDEMDTYLPAFRATVTEGQGRLGDVRLQQHQRRSPPAPTSSCCRISCAANGSFKGYVVSDCGAVVDIFQGHHFTPTSRRPPPSR